VKKRRAILEIDADSKWKLEKIRSSLEHKERSITGLNAVLAGVPKERDRTMIIWHALAGFANASEGEELGFHYFHAFTHLCCLRLDEIFADPTEDLRCFEDVEREYDQTRRPLEDIFRSRASALREQVRVMLAWLVRPNAYSSTAKRHALEFLLYHGGDHAIQVGRDPTDKFDDTGNHGIPLFYWQNIYGYQTVFSPAAKFILDRLEQYHERHLPLEKAMPLIICKRPECGKFVVARRKTKDFCSDSCRTLYRQKDKPKAWAAYMRKYRSVSY
jgi:hypothetical protein